MGAEPKICPSCKEKNNPALTACWKCHTSFTDFKSEKSTATVYAMKGVGELLEVYDGKVVITPQGFGGFLAKGGKGAKTIPLFSITGVAFKKSGFVCGYLQFTIPGSIEGRGDVIDTVMNENSFMFKGQNELAQEIKNYVEKRIQELHRPQTVPSSGSIADELQKLADLKTKGILSEEEFLFGALHPDPSGAGYARNLHHC